MCAANENQQAEISARRFTETLLNNLPGMVYRCANDQSWTMIFASTGCEALTGHTAEFVIANRLGWIDLIHKDDRDEARAVVSDALRAGKQFDIQYRIVDKRGQEKWVREQGCGVRSASGSTDTIEGYIDDITPLRHAVLAFARSEAYFEENIRPELRRQRELLAHADRLNTLGEMATGIAHEVNQPLAAISLFAQAGRRLLDAGEFEKLRPVLDKLSKHARRAGAIVERIQDLARRSDSARQSIELNELVQDVVELAEIDARMHNIRIDISPGFEPLKINVDVVQIQQVILNVLRNGMDAMKAVQYRNGNIIRLVTGLHTGGFVQVDVIDSGSGVSDEIAEKIFETFSTSKNSGLGMGLPISKAIVEAHGGQLLFNNNEDEGARFSIVLPAATDEKQHG